jgi:hypothetical protein
MNKCVALRFPSVVREEERWYIETLYRLQAIEQGNSEEQVSFAKDR